MGLFELIAGVFGYSKRQARIVVIGLDNSGKTTLINHIKPKKVGRSSYLRLYSDIVDSCYQLGVKLHCRITSHHVFAGKHRNYPTSMK